MESYKRLKTLTPETLEPYTVNPSYSPNPKPQADVPVKVDGRLVHVDFGYALGREPLDSVPWILVGNGRVGFRDHKGLS